MRATGTTSPRVKAGTPFGRFIEALEETTDYITATEIGTLIKKQVFSDAAACGHAQTPQGGKLFGLGDYVFVPRQTAVASVEAKPMETPGSVPFDMQVCDRIEDSTDAADFVTFIESFPSSPMVPYARNRVKALTEVETALLVPPEPEAPATKEEAVGVYPQTFRDCAECPEMVVIPAGEFVMGSPEFGAEWEYAARAGTTTARFWGEDADRVCGYANVYDQTGKREHKFDWMHHECDDGYAQTAPVGSFAANAFGVHDMLGNVWEWAEDCWNDPHKAAPRDGSAWRSGNCGQRVLRGGSWSSYPWDVPAAYRVRSGAEVRFNLIGFRVARTLDR